MKQDAKRLSKERHEKDYAKKLAKQWKNFLTNNIRNLEKSKAPHWKIVRSRQLKRVCEALLKFA